MYPPLPCEFYARDVLDVAPALLGQYLIRKLPDGNLMHYQITETEAYRGTEDAACHVHKSRTPRNEVMFDKPGTLYIYLIYGIHHMLNIVTAPKGEPQAVLIRGVTQFSGPGRLTRGMQITREWNKQSVCYNNTLWVAAGPTVTDYITGPRVGINYASEPWRSKPWRYSWNNF